VIAGTNCKRSKAWRQLFLVILCRVDRRSIGGELNKSEPPVRAGVRDRDSYDHHNLEWPDAGLLSCRLSDKSALITPRRQRKRGQVKLKLLVGEGIGGIAMTMNVENVLLFSCLVFFVTGIVIAAASLLWPR
jgi:hypothetical protein